MCKIGTYLKNRKQSQFATFLYLIYQMTKIEIILEVLEFGMELQLLFNICFVTFARIAVGILVTEPGLCDVRLSLQIFAVDLSMGVTHLNLFVLS